MKHHVHPAGRSTHECMRRSGSWICWKIVFGNSKWADRINVKATGRLRQSICFKPFEDFDGCRNVTPQIVIGLFEFLVRPVLRRRTDEFPHCGEAIHATSLYERTQEQKAR